jgi:serine/threonine protein kinase
MEPKYAREEYEKGQMIEEKFKEAGLTPSDYFVLPSDLCPLPNNYSAEEEAMNPIKSCQLQGLTPPTLLSMEYGGIALDKFYIGIYPTSLEMLREFGKACIGLLEKLATLHQLQMAHLDIKPGNLVINVKDDTYDIRFIDVGFVQVLDALNPSTIPTGFLNNYVIWPFETRFLKKPIPLTNVNYPEIVSFFKECVEQIPKYGGINEGYFSKPGNQFVFLMPGDPFQIDTFMDYYRGIPEPQRYAEIAKQTDVYSMGFTIMGLFRRIVFPLFGKNSAIEQFQMYLYEQVVGPMMEPNPRLRCTAEYAAEAMRNFHEKVLLLIINPK